MTEEGGVQRAKADLEILLAAFPDEVTMIEAPDDSSLSPNRFILSLTSSNKQSDTATHQKQLHWANITMEFPINGYPTTSPLRVLSYRGGGCTKQLLERIVCLIRDVAKECCLHGEDAAIPCCSAATTAWVEALEANDTSATQALEVEQQKQLEQEIKMQWDDIQWITGETITDRKSVFQAHVTQVHSDEMVQRALEKLMSNSKIARATHNMYAYRFTQYNPDKKTTILKHDNDDDGEDAAGGRIAHLLDLRKEDGVLVVVTRWYGGIQLGSKRFHHIVNSARELLDHCHQQGLIVKS
mmetsp:Transcript_18667/g.26454  ORF Transcript_18667/g.26454 Transcript_18667/m.26454 type:complete len:298 (+) Transcript_18667:17-910(+)